MGLDVYSGTLTRYYSGNWETVVEKWAKEQSIEYRLIRLDEDEDEDEENVLTNPKEIQKEIVEWQKNLKKFLQEYITEEFWWDENNEKEYDTDKPDWDCYGALVLWALYLEQNKKYNKEILEKDWDWSKDPIYKISFSENYISKYEQLTMGCELWIPVDFNFVFTYDAPTGNEIIIGSCFELFRKLEDMNKMTWQASEKEIKRWREEIDPNTNLFEDKAKFGFSIFFQLTQFSINNRVPLKLDY